MNNKNILIRIQENWKAGLAVSLVSLPMAVTLAVASHATPVQGVITAIWAGLIASLFGGSNYNIVGPTGALSGLLAMYAITHGQAVLPTLAILSGLIILAAYVFHWERYIIFVPSSTIHGFVLGVALIIMFNQLNFAIGLENLPMHAHFISNVFESLKNISHASLITSGLFVVSTALLFVAIRIAPRIPGAILISPIGILLGYLCSNHYIPLSMATLETKFANLNPQLVLAPSFMLSANLIIPASTIAIIAILETIISAKIADGITRTKHNQNKELLGLGLANIASGLAGGIPATAALARTTLNIRSGGNNKMAATISSVLIIVISLAFLAFFKYMPLAIVAAILVVVGIRMIETHHFIKMFKTDKTSFVVSGVVALCTVLADPIIGIIVGAAISMVLFMKTVSQGSYEMFDVPRQSPSTIPQAGPDTIVYTIKGALAYINAQAHLNRFEKQMPSHKNVVLDLRNVYFIDQDGIDAFAEIVDLLKKQKKSIHIVNAHEAIAPVIQETLKPIHSGVHSK